MGLSFWKDYNYKNAYDGYITDDCKLRKHAKIISNILERNGKKKLLEIEKNCQSTINARGINFRVYAANNRAEEKKWPLDIIPRIIPKTQWNKVAKGLTQRVNALNLFIDDVYNEKKIFKDKVIPKDLVFKSQYYIKECNGFSPKYKAWSNISGIDLIRNINGEYLVLEDNLRVPSVVSYMLENRMFMRDVFPELFTRYKVSSIHQYANKLYHCMLECIPKKKDDPHMVVLTPGIYNSAYFEHSFLAEQMGIALVEGKDLFVENDIVYMKTVSGKLRVDSIYRRLDHNIMDPKVHGVRYRSGDELVDKFQDKFLGQIGMRIMQRPQGKTKFKTKEELNEFMNKMFIENVWCFGPKTDLFKSSRKATLDGFFA